MIHQLCLISLAIFILGAVIGFHELGHFLAARRRGLIAPIFSIGFGPKLIGWSRAGTDFRICLIPIGGYVSLPQLAEMGKVEGQRSEAKKLPPISYTDKILVSVMGPVFNLIMALAISTIVWAVGRDINISTTIAEVATEITNDEGAEIAGPAYQAGLCVGDTILEVDGNPVNSWMEVRNAIVIGAGIGIDGKRESLIKVKREGQTLELSVHPAVVGAEGFRSIGMIPTVNTVRIHENPLHQITSMAETTYETLAALLNRDSDVKARNMSGPVGIVYGLSALGRYSIIDMLWFATLINVNLALINMVPLPVLDGGHILFATIGKVTGKRVSIRLKIAIHTAFAVFLLCFIVYVSFFDMSRIGRATGLIDHKKVTERLQESQ